MRTNDGQRQGKVPVIDTTLLTWVRLVTRSTLQPQ